MIGLYLQAIEKEKARLKSVGLSNKEIRKRILRMFISKSDQMAFQTETWKEIFKVLSDERLK